MSEHSGNTQPIRPIKDDTQPLKPIQRAPRWRTMLLSLLGALALLTLGGVGGYAGGIQARQGAKTQAEYQSMLEQFQLALVDQQFGNYQQAKERLEYIISINPSFPGVQEELAKVLVLSSIPTATPTPMPTSTPDLRGVQALFNSAQQLIAAGDWSNALNALDQLRKQDPKYNTVQVDGMYYFALRNYGVALIQQGNLEGGIYQLTLAERFAPLDREANGLREGARLYIQAASFFGIDWKQAVDYFSQVAGAWPSLWDGSMTASQRYYIALMRYGDQLFASARTQQDYCIAYNQYATAQSIAPLDQMAEKNANQAYQQCYPPTETPTPTTVAPPAETPTPTP